MLAYFIRSTNAARERAKKEILSVLYLFLSLSANEQYFLRQEKENISAVPRSFQLNIGFSFIYIFFFSPSDTLQGKREEEENQFPTVPKVDRQTTSQAVNECRTYF